MMLLIPGIGFAFDFVWIGFFGRFDFGIDFYFSIG